MLIYSIYLSLFCALMMLLLYELLRTEQKSTPTPLLSKAKSFAARMYPTKNYDNTHTA